MGPENKSRRCHGSVGHGFRKPIATSLRCGKNATRSKVSKEGLTNHILEYCIGHLGADSENKKGMRPDIVHRSWRHTYVRCRAD